MPSMGNFDSPTQTQRLSNTLHQGRGRATKITILSNHVGQNLWVTLHYKISGILPPRHAEYQFNIKITSLLEEEEKQA